MSKIAVLNKNGLYERINSDLLSLGLAVVLFTEPGELLDAYETDPFDLLLVVYEREDFSSTINLLREVARTEQSYIILVIDKESLDELDDLNQFDDIMLADFNRDELALRIKLGLSRYSNKAGDGRIVIGRMIIDPQTFEVRINGSPVSLTYREYQLLSLLAAERGKVFTRQTLLENAWGYDYMEGMRTVDVHIRRLRSKLGARYGSLIETVRHVGYRFSRYDPELN